MRTGLASQPAAGAPLSRHMVLMFTDVAGSTHLKQPEAVGAAAYAELARAHDALLAGIVASIPGAEILKDLGDGFLVAFRTASDAVHAALRFQHGLFTDRTFSPSGTPFRVRAGIHQGEVSVLERDIQGKAKVVGPAADLAARIQSLALPGQILVSRAIFDDAQQYVREHPECGEKSLTVRPRLRWQAHGEYRFKGIEAPQEVFEVGAVGCAPFVSPPDSEKAEQANSAGVEAVRGSLPEVEQAKAELLQRRAKIVVCGLVSVAIGTAVGANWGENAAEATGVTSAFERWVFRTPPPAVSSAELKHVAVVGFRSTNEVEDVVQRLRVKGKQVEAVDLGKARTWRSVYPALIEELIESDAGATAVSFDIVFGGPTETDERWAKVAAKAKFPIIVGLDTGKLDLGTTDALNANVLQPPTRWGGVTAMFDDSRGWRDDLLMERESQPPRPGLPLQTLASVCFPKPAAVHRFVIDESAHRIVVESHVRDPALPTVELGDGPPYPVWTTSTVTIRDPSPEDQKDLGLRDGDRITDLMLAIPPQEQLDAVTHTIRDVLDASPETRRAWFKGRAIFVANMTSLAPDHFPHPDGRDLWGVYGHAVAYEALLTGGGVHRVGNWVVFVCAVGAALLSGALLGLGEKRRVVFVAVAAALLAALVVLLFGVSYWFLRNTLCYIPVYAPVASAIVTALLIVAIRLTGGKRLRWITTQSRGSHETEAAR
ncbi:MAG: CHASE2 domain-containing protein [Phycisphaerales bacterium]